MKSLFSFDSPIMKLLRGFTDLIVLNLLWLLFSLPLITMGASTAALYQCILKLKKGENGHLWSEFLTYFRENFKQATILLLISSAVIALTVLDLIVIYSLIPNVDILLKILAVLPFLLVVPGIGYVFPLQAFFENSVIQTLKNAWFMSLIHFPISLVILALNLTPVVIFLFYPQLFIRCVPIWICLASSVIAYANMSLLNDIFLQWVEK